MTIETAHQQLQRILQEYYDAREAATITGWVMEAVTGWNKVERWMYRTRELTESQTVLFQVYSKELAGFKPVQYVLGKAWFAGMVFEVNEHTLIPRPETEELVEWVLESLLQFPSIPPVQILDIGTGSGCIPIVLKKKFSTARVTSVDVSMEALQVARQNAALWETEIQFIEINFLDEAAWSQLPMANIIVSNPPYIKHSEAASMAKHVVDFEPPIALFVPDEDALLFYKKIAAFGRTHLHTSGMIFLEINEVLGIEVIHLFEENGYDVVLKKDLQGKDRMIQAIVRNYPQPLQE